MKKVFIIGTLGLFLLGACNNKADKGHNEHDHATEQHDHEAEGPEHDGHDHGTETKEGSNEIVLTPEKARAAGVEVSEITPGIFHQVIRTSGQVLAAQGDERIAVAPVAGIVSFRHRVVEGMSVSKGSPLVVLSSDNLADGDPVQKARVAYEVAQKEYERMKALVGDKIVSEKEFAQARQTYENARISYEAVARNQSGDGQVVTAPMTGYIKNLLVKEGDYVSVGQPLASITQNRRLYLRAEVSERYYKDLPGVVSANFKTPYDDRVYSLDELHGRVLSYGKSTDETLYYLPITFEFDNRGDIVPGSFVEIYLLSGEMTDVMTLPKTAITEEQGLNFVYLQLDEEGYMKQEVKLGADNGRDVQILSGVKPGDRVVVEGAYHVKLASASNAIPAHTHEH